MVDWIAQTPTGWCWATSCTLPRMTSNRPTDHEASSRHAAHSHEVRTFDREGQRGDLDSNECKTTSRLTIMKSNLSLHDGRLLFIDSVAISRTSLADVARMSTQCSHHAIDMLSSMRFDALQSEFVCFTGTYSAMLRQHGTHGRQSASINKCKSQPTSSSACSAQRTTPHRRQDRGTVLRPGCRRCGPEAGEGESEAIPCRRSQSRRRRQAHGRVAGQASRRRNPPRSCSNAS